LRVHSQGTRTIFGAACTSREACEFWREKASSTIEAASGSALQLNSDAHPLLPWYFFEFFYLPCLNSVAHPLLQFALSHAPIITNYHYYFCYHPDRHHHLSLHRCYTVHIINIIKGPLIYFIITCTLSHATRSHDHHLLQ
jgi:hypothetical protein